jgi:hypothetical protein
VRCEAVVNGQHFGQQSEGVPMAHLVFTNALHRPLLSLGIGQLDKTTVGQFGTRLQGNVELAVAVKCLKPQLPSER